MSMDFITMQQNAADAVNLLKGLANESRLMIMCVLAEGEVSVGQLNSRIKLSQSALSQHLANTLIRLRYLDYLTSLSRPLLLGIWVGGIGWAAGAWLPATPWAAITSGGTAPW